MNLLTELYKVGHLGNFGNLIKDFQDIMSSIENDLENHDTVKVMVIDALIKALEDMKP